MKPENKTTEKPAMIRSMVELNGRKNWTSEVVSKPMIPAKRNGPKEEKSYCALAWDREWWG